MASYEICVGRMGKMNLFYLLLNEYSWKRLAMEMVNGSYI
ncbi:hypothetical protein AC140_13070 [Bacteroides fragilis]|nr:hypothetical protein AC140_13070 [Bacteroides fragilis]